MERISVYIDGPNFYHGVKSINSKYKDFHFDLEKYINKITKGKRLIQIYYYNASIKQKQNPELFELQQKFFVRLRKIPKLKVVLCKRQKRTNSDGNNYFAIKGDDIHLAIDMLKDAYEKKYDTAILISGDGDFAPVVKYVQNIGKKVENYHFNGCISLNLISKCNASFTITKKTLNKFFYRENPIRTIGDIIQKK
jgi:uncharacterized LabA/DUF88 family protein